MPTVTASVTGGPRRRRRPRAPRSLRLDHGWAIVLAGGSGTRLASLTTTAGGAVVPKQFCSLQGGRSLLGDALARADGLVGADRVVVVVAAQHASLWQRELAGRDPRGIVVQPHNRGTAAGVLLPLLAVLARDPDAQVALLPADHFVADEAGLARALTGSMSTAAVAGRVMLLGVGPEGPETDYGWILPGRRRGAVQSVQRFVEKPDRLAAAALMRRGAVWNSFLLAGAATSLLRLFALRLPALLAAFRAHGIDTAAPRLGRLYASLGDADFCRDVLTGAERELGLQVAPSCGWTDLGTPSRVARCSEWLARSGRGASRPGSLGARATASVGSRRGGPRAQASR